MEIVQMKSQDTQQSSEKNKEQGKNHPANQAYSGYMNRQMRRRMAQMQPPAKSQSDDSTGKAARFERVKLYLRQNWLWIVGFAILILIAIILSIHS